MNIEKNKTGYSKASGVIVRGDLSMLVWREDVGIEILLTSEQCIDLALSLLAASRDAPGRAKHESEDACHN